MNPMVGPEMKKKWANVRTFHSSAVSKHWHWLMVVAFLAATGYPFKFHVPPWLNNGVEIDSRSILFSTPGVAVIPEQSKWIEEVIRENQFSIGLKLR